MEDEPRITPEQLAYLNENLDTVNEYVAKFPRDFVWLSGKRILHITGKTYDENNLRYAVFNLRYAVFASTYNTMMELFWKPLLEYVENNSNTPPILK